MLNNFLLLIFYYFIFFRVRQLLLFLALVMARKQGVHNRIGEQLTWHM